MHEDLTGKVFNRWKVINYAGFINGQSMWSCVCQCGIKRNVRASALKKGASKSCGCLLKEMMVIIGYKRRKPKRPDARLLSIYNSMLHRCYNPNMKVYPIYGGRGLKVSDDWLGENGYENFKQWAYNNGYDDKLTIDRTDNNMGYSPNNCRWVTMKVQNNNKRDNRVVIYQGKRYTIAELSELCGIKPSTLSYRLDRNWSIEKAINTPVDEKKSMAGKSWDHYKRNIQTESEQAEYGREQDG